MAGIYLHIPFCKQACHYCNFYFSTSLAMKDSFLSALLKEIELTKEYLAEEKIETIYFGGGTPSLLNETDFKRIIEAIYTFYNVSTLREFTIEANPDDLTPAKLKELASLKEIGLNRLSIGVQSFSEEDLKYMNRAHTSAEAMDCIKLAQDCGFANLSIDLIYGTPTMDDTQWQKNLDTVFGLNVPHISSYALTVESKTALERKIKNGERTQVDEQQTARQFEYLMRRMKEQGYEQYEISNFAKPNQYAVHNTNYWRGKKYLGLGPSAHSYNKIARRWNVANNASYIYSIAEGKLPIEEEVLTEVQRVNEYLLTSLRTMWGCNLKNFSPDVTQHCLKVLTEKIDADYYKLDADVLYLTDSGKLFADRIASELFIE